MTHFSWPRSTSGLISLIPLLSQGPQMWVSLTWLRFQHERWICCVSSIRLKLAHLSPTPSPPGHLDFPLPFCSLPSCSQNSPWLVQVGLSLFHLLKSPREKLDLLTWYLIHDPQSINKIIPKNYVRFVRLIVNSSFQWTQWERALGKQSHFEPGTLQSSENVFLQPLSKLRCSLSISGLS